MNAEELNNKGLELYQHSKYKDAKAIAEQALALAQETADAKQEARAFLISGITATATGNYPDAQLLLQQSLVLSEKHDFKAGISQCYRSIGVIYAELYEYSLALEYCHRALTLDEESGNKRNIAISTSNVGTMYSLLNNYPLSLEYFHKALAFSQETDDKQNIANIIGNIGSIYSRVPDYHRALEYLYQALHLNEELSKSKGIADTNFNIAATYSSIPDFPLALEHCFSALKLYEELGLIKGVANTMGLIGNLYLRKSTEDYYQQLAEEFLLKAYKINDEVGTQAQNIEVCRDLAQLYQEQERWKEAMQLYKQHHELEKKIINEEATIKAAQLEQKKQIAEREKHLAAERARAQATQELLYNTLPPQIADRLLAGERIADSHTEVSVLFADIVDFTRLSQSISPKELVECLDTLFSTFDDLAEKYKLEKIKTIGDCYMVIAGAPLPRIDHAIAIANMAIEMLNILGNFRVISTGNHIKLRIGLHTGEVVAGVIGRRKYTYDMWGDAVNTAARMESHGEANKIHVSEEFMHAFVGTGRDLSVRDAIHFIERSEMEIKGKGLMRTYFMEKI